MANDLFEKGRIVRSFRHNERLCDEKLIRYCQITLRDYTMTDFTSEENFNGTVYGALYNKAVEIEGNDSEASVKKGMKKIINQMIEKNKGGGTNRGRTPYGAEQSDRIIFRRNEDGKLSVEGYEEEYHREKGQHRFNKEDNKNFTKVGIANKNVEKVKSTLDDAGKAVRKMYPNESVETTTKMIAAFKKYASEKKKSVKALAELVMDRKRIMTFKEDEKGEYVMSLKRPTMKAPTPLKTEGRIIKITSSMVHQLNETDIKMTMEKFFSGVKKFLGDLLTKNTKAQPNDTLKRCGLDRTKLIKQLKTSGIIKCQEKIVDKNKDGSKRKEASMQVKYSVPKSDKQKESLDNKLMKLYIKNYEENIVEECDCGGCGCDGGGATSCSFDGAGSFLTPMALVSRSFYSPRRRKKKRKKRKKRIHETDCSSVGNYQYDAPVLGDDETLSRKNGEGGSVSINYADD